MRLLIERPGGMPGLNAGVECPGGMPGLNTPVSPPAPPERRFRFP